MSHYPVMLPEMLEALSPRDGGIYVDGTFGAGGYTRAILDAAECRVVAIDRDADARVRAEGLQKDYGDRLVFVHGCFGDVEGLLHQVRVERVDGFVLDLGVSSMQLDEAERGFSFRHDAPLDMRMDHMSGESAADLVNAAEQKELADLIYKYGEERKSRWIAKKIIELRKNAPIRTTFELADIVRSVVPKSKDGIDPATRTFQALRIAVNDELGELERALDAAENILNPGGRMVVVSFHSLEDRIVKAVFKEKSGRAANASRYAPAAQNNEAVVFDLLTNKALTPSAKEVAENSRSRSAKLRAAQYIGGAS